MEFGVAVLKKREEALKFFAGSSIFRGMSLSDSLNDPMVCRLGESRKPAEPCSIVIFGASGDLTARKLIPALYHLFKEKQMPPDFRIVGFARREKTDESWR